MMYSIVPYELIFRNELQNNPESKEITYKGQKLIVTQLEENLMRVERIISSCPSVYLNNEIQPGRIIKAYYE